jgi:hypothetical protein
MTTSVSTLSTAITDDFISPTQFCQKYRFAHSTLSKYIHKGDIALHQFSDAARPKINVAEALQVMSAIKRPYTAPTLRLVRHDDTAPKTDLFA